MTFTPRDIEALAGYKSSWAEADLDEAFTGNVAEPPTLLERADGHCLLYPGRIHALNAEPEALKSWLALKACADALRNCRTDPGRVVYIDLEDSARAIIGRLLALGLTREEIVGGGFTYVRPDEPLEEGSRAAFDFDNWGPGPAELVVVDGLTEAFAVEGLSPLDNSDVGKWLDLVPRPLARKGAAVLLLDHVVKNREDRGRYALGAQHKLAGVDVAYSLRVIEPFGRGRDGRVAIKVEKDRPGHVREFAAAGGQVALMRATSLADGDVRITLDPPEGERADFRPTGFMERISRKLETDPGLSKNAIRKMVTGKNDWKHVALELLISEGYVEVRKVDQTHQHYSIKPYREEHDDHDGHNRAPVPQPCPNRAPGTGVADRAPVPPPLTGHGHGHGSNGHTDDPNRAPTSLAAESNVTPEMLARAEDFLTRFGEEEA